MLHWLADQCLLGTCQRLSANSPLTGPTHQILPRGLSTKSWVLRMYFANMASDECPVCARMLDDYTPDMAALVANPARKLCPEYSVGLSPTAATRSLMTNATDCADRRSGST